MLRRFVLVASLIALAGCDSDDPAVPGLPGRASVQVTGTPAFEFSGGASFLVSPPPAGVTVMLTDDRLGSRRSVGLLFYDIGSLEAGTYPIGDRVDSTGSSIALIVRDEPVHLFATEGSVTLTRATEETIEGTFEARLAAVTGVPAEPVPVQATITGSFEAEQVAYPPD